jgi:putative colanic acid biosynthesis acetyltransferase WcaB
MASVAPASVGPRAWKDDLLQDWTANRGAGKSQLIMVLFRLVARWHRGPRRPWHKPLTAGYTVLVNWVLGVELPPATQVGPALCLMHPQSIVINPDTRIGRGCTIRALTVLGNIVKADGTITGSPRLHDDVELGVGVMIIGPVEIGAGARVGAGAVVIGDVPAGAVAVGNPAHIVGAGQGVLS